MLPHGENLQDVLPRDIYRRLKRHLEYVKLMMPSWMTPDQRGKGLYADYLFNAIAGNWERKRPVWVMLMVNSLTEADIKTRGVPVLDLYLAQEAERMRKKTGAVEKVEEQCHPLNGLNFSQESLRAGSLQVPYTADDLIKHYNCGDLNSIIFSHDSSQVPNFNNVTMPPSEQNTAQEIDSYFRQELIYKRNERMGKRVKTLLEEHPDKNFFFAFGAGAGSSKVSETDIPFTLESSPKMLVSKAAKQRCPPTPLPQIMSGWNWVSPYMPVAVNSPGRHLFESRLFHCRPWTGVPRGLRTIGRALPGAGGLGEVRSARVSSAHRTPATPIVWLGACRLACHFLGNNTVIDVLRREGYEVEHTPAGQPINSEKSQKSPSSPLFTPYSTAQELEQEPHLEPFRQEQDQEDELLPHMLLPDSLDLLEKVDRKYKKKRRKQNKKRLRQFNDLWVRIEESTTVAPPRPLVRIINGYITVEPFVHGHGRSEHIRTYVDSASLPSTSLLLFILTSVAQILTLHLY
ncbi:TIKI1 Metalloprotease, partial [Polyodon spathula]|nr:TIKI1 Metalloprotease [Polyodon spathula]